MWWILFSNSTHRPLVLHLLDDTPINVLQADAEGDLVTLHLRPTPHVCKSNHDCIVLLQQSQNPSLTGVILEVLEVDPLDVGRLDHLHPHLRRRAAHFVREAWKRRTIEGILSI